MVVSLTVEPGLLLKSSSQKSFILLNYSIMEPLISSIACFLTLEALFIERLQFHFSFAIDLMVFSRIFGFCLNFLSRFFANHEADKMGLSKAREHLWWFKQERSCHVSSFTSFLHVAYHLHLLPPVHTA